MKDKYPNADPNNTFWDDYHRKKGMMTNNEFFTSNGPGGFYEGMWYDEENNKWVPNGLTYDEYVNNPTEEELYDESDDEW